MKIDNFIIFFDKFPKPNMELCADLVNDSKHYLGFMVLNKPLKDYPNCLKVLTSL